MQRRRPHNSSLPGHLHNLRHPIRRLNQRRPQQLSHLRCKPRDVNPTSLHTTTNTYPQDPRQYVPESGQSWSCLDFARSLQKNIIETDEQDPRIHYIYTKPLPPSEQRSSSGLEESLADSMLTHKQLGIGQRAILLETDGGNVLWDLVALLDDDTIDFIRSKGGLKAIVISHPHYYTTHIDWAEEFKCPVYVSKEDEEWLCREDKEGVRKWVKSVDEIEEVNGAVTAVQCGGHFDGSLVLMWEKKMFIADTIMHVPVCLRPSQLQWLFVANGWSSLVSTIKTVHRVRLAIRSSGRIRTVSTHLLLLCYRSLANIFRSDTSLTTQDPRNLESYQAF
jgi:hypothetical protein